MCIVVVTDALLLLVSFITVPNGNSEGDRIPTREEYLREWPCSYPGVGRLSDETDRLQD